MSLNTVGTLRNSRSPIVSRFTRPERTRRTSASAPVSVVSRRRAQIGAQRIPQPVVQQIGPRTAVDAEAQRVRPDPRLHAGDMPFHPHRNLRHGPSARQAPHAGVRHRRIEQRQHPRPVVEQQIVILIDLVAEQSENLRPVLQMRHVETKELPAAGTDSVEIESGDRHDVHPRDGGVHPL